MNTISNISGRERLLRTFRNQKVDRIPICPWVYNNLIYEFFKIPPEKQKWGHDYLAEKEIEVLDYFGFDHLIRLATPWHGCYLVEKSSGDSKWIVGVDNKTIDGKEVEITRIKTPEKTLRQIRESIQISEYTKVSAIKEYFIKDKSDFNQFLKYQPSFEKAVYSEIEDEFMNLERAKKALGNKGMIVSYTSGAFNMLNLYRSYEDILTDPYSDTSFYKAMIEYFSIRFIKTFEKMIENGADILELGANLATSMVGQKFFEDFVLEYEKNVVEKVHKLGAFVIFHNCGDAGKIMHLYNDLNIDAWGYLTPPPHGDVDFDKALSTIDKDIVLIGNIDQVNFVPKATPEEIEENVKGVLDKAKKRGNFILSTTDWFSDNTPYKNIKAISKAGRKYGRYDSKYI